MAIEEGTLHLVIATYIMAAGAVGGGAITAIYLVKQYRANQIHNSNLLEETKKNNEFDQKLTTANLIFSKLNDEKKKNITRSDW